MAKKREIKVKPEWFDEELEAAAKVAEGKVWQQWEREMIRRYSARGVGGGPLAARINARRAESGLSPRTVGSVRCAVIRYKQ